MGMIRSVRMRMQVLAVMTLMLVGIAVSAAPAGAVTAYLDPQQRYAIGVLDGWVQSPSMDNFDVSWTIDGDGAFFGITSVKIPSGTSSTDFAVATVTQLASMTDYKELRRDFVNSGDQQSPRLDYMFSQNGVPLRAQIVFISRGADGYALTFLTRLVDHQDYVDAVDTMVYSFTLS